MAPFPQGGGGGGGGGAAAAAAAEEEEEEEEEEVCTDHLTLVEYTDLISLRKTFDWHLKVPRFCLIH